MDRAAIATSGLVTEKILCPEQSDPVIATPNKTLYKADFRCMREEIYREKFFQALAKMIEQSAGVVFLDNFQWIFTSEFLKRVGLRLINVHPSVLPLLKGFRTERKALEGRTPYANGFTIHQVVDPTAIRPEVDSGATIFSCHVPAEHFQNLEIPSEWSESFSHSTNPELLYREEISRTAMMHIEAEIVPDVLRLYLMTKDMPGMQIIVKDEDAFAAEGRPDFMFNINYREQLKAEHDTWQKEHDTKISYKDWDQKHRIPYQRVLFKSPFDDRYLTAEQLLYAQFPVEMQAREIPDIVPRALYVFPTPENENIMKDLQQGFSGEVWNPYFKDKRLELDLQSVITTNPDLVRRISELSPLRFEVPVASGRKRPSIPTCFQEAVENTLSGAEG